MEGYSSRVVFLVLRRMRAPLVVLIVSYGISVLGFVLIPGVDEQGRPWRMDFLHAFYFVSYTGSTIGFGELPAPFTPAQRTWATFTIYLTVVSWVYALGKLLTLVQDEAIRRAVRENRFRRTVRLLAEPFVIVCGYGDTGRLLVHALSLVGIRTVVIDHDPRRVEELSLEEPGYFIPALHADARSPDVLATAGIDRDSCLAVVAITGSDAVNLKIAITVKLINPRLTVTCRADHSETTANMASFGTDHIVNAFDVFADRLALALHSPSQHLIHEWLTSVPDSPLMPPLYPPHGRWILCGYGRLGKALSERLSRESVAVTIVEQYPERMGCADRCVRGRGTEAETLHAADVAQAAGIVAGTDDDANNLSIIMTAHQINPALFFVARQNERENGALFDAAGLHVVMHRSDIVARRIFSLLTNPLLLDFLALSQGQGERWAHQLASRIRDVTEGTVPEVWTINLQPQEAPAVAEALGQGRGVVLGDLMRDLRIREERLSCLALAVAGGGHLTLLPRPTISLRMGDRLLFCGQASAFRQMQWAITSRNALYYLQTGEEPPGGIGRRFASR